MKRQRLKITWNKWKLCRKGNNNIQINNDYQNQTEGSGESGGDGRLGGAGK